MDKSKQNTNLGLSKEELELLVNNSNDPTLLKEYEEKLENCDLSKSAIELINKEDLAAVSRISDGVLSNFGNSSSSNYSKITILSSITAITIGVFIYLFNSPTDSIKETAVVKTTNSLPSKKKVIRDNNTTLSEVTPKEKINSENKTLAIKTQESKIITEPQVLDSVVNKVKDVNSDIEKIQASKEAELQQKPKERDSDIEYVAKKEPRQIREISITKSTPIKYKNEPYSFSDLVAYYGGKDELETDLINQLKGKIKDSDVPEKHSTVVFKFEVSSKGKVREINILSIVAPELEQRIKETTTELNSWKKGKKRIPQEYTVYITFK